MTEQTSAAPLQSMRRMIRGSSLLLALAVVTAAVFFDGLMACSVLLGGFLILGNLIAFTWLAARWWKQHKTAVAIALFFKLWVTLGLLYVVLLFLPVNVYAVIAGMGCMLVSLLVQASAEVKNLLEEGRSDA